MHHLKLGLLACIGIAALVQLTLASALTHCPTVTQIQNRHNWFGNSIFGWEAVLGRKITMENAHQFTGAVYIRDDDYASCDYYYDVGLYRYDSTNPELGSGKWKQGIANNELICESSSPSDCPFY